MTISMSETRHRNQSFYEKTLEVHNYIDGEFVERLKTIQSRNPSTDRVNALIPDSSAADVDRAVSAANNAFERWSWSWLIDHLI